MNTRQALVLLGAVLVAFAAGTRAYAKAPSSRAGGDVDALAQEVHALRDEIASARGELARAPEAQNARCAFDSQTIAAIAAAVSSANPNNQVAPTLPANVPPPRSLEAETALAHAGDLVKASIDRGTLSVSDGTEIRRALAVATPEEQHDIRVQIARAVTDRKLVLENSHALP
jgi:hypothetical protein